MIPLLLASVAAQSGGVVTLSDEIINDTDAPTQPTVGWRLNTDGTVDLFIGGAWNQINNSTDWIIPNEYATDQYWLRFTLDGSPSGFTFSSAGDYIGTPDGATWIQANAVIAVGGAKTTSASGTGLAGVDVEIATDAAGANIIESCNLSFGSTVP